MRRAIFALLLMVLPVSVVSAQTYDPGIITPEHGFLYQLDMLFDNIKIAISPDKTSALMDVLNERLAEINISRGNYIVIYDYEEKLRELETEVVRLDNATKMLVSAELERHKKVLEEVEDLVPEHAKPAIRQAINESSRVFYEVEKEEHVEHNLNRTTYREYEEHSYSSSGSEISLPSSVKVNQEVRIRVKIYNPTDKPINPVVYIEAKKEGAIGWIIKKNYMYKLPVTIEPGKYYEKEFSFTVPDSFMGMSTTGTWEVEVKVTANGVELIEKEFRITVGE